MGKFTIRRFLWMLLVLFVVSLITFALMHAVPGGPFSLEKALPAQTVAQLNAKYHLDEPITIQYLRYVTDILVPVVLTGPQQKSVDHEYLINIRLPFGDNTMLHWANFGPSIKSISRTVNDIFRENLPISFQLGILALLVAVVIGVPLGIVSAVKRNTLYDYAGMGVAILVVCPTLRQLLGTAACGSRLSCPDAQSAW
jgi:ABC-type dipeptide/oligopeptide/nickel transport system permease component